jgi:hypothetical protein
MNTLKDLLPIHDSAMKYAQEAYLAQLNGQKELAQSLYFNAFELEQEVALHYLHLLDKEPTRAITFRSAASLAMQCRKYREAEKLIAQGLEGNPPTGIAQELRELYEEVKNVERLDTIPKPPKQSSKSSKPLWIRGLLLVANAKEKNSFIEIVLQSDKADVLPKDYSKVFVPNNTLTTLVNQYWNHTVNLKVKPKGRHYELVAIENV